MRAPFDNSGRSGYEKKDFIRVNHHIRAPRIRVVLDDGGMLGVMAPHEALREAQKRGLDLVEISPKANPPVCKIMDFGKFKYEQKKKAQGQKKTQAGNVLKEISLSPQTDQHDLDFKMRNSARFLEEGHRVKVSIRFRGREMAHPEIGHRQMEKVVEALRPYGVAEANPKMEGRILAALFNPLTAAARAKLQKEAANPSNSTLKVDSTKKPS